MSLQIFDTHAHYTDEAFEGDRDELLSSLPDFGVKRVVIPGCDVKTSREAIALSRRYPWIFAAAGIHPEEVLRMRGGDPERIRDMLADSRVVAVGEIGLDYHYGKESAEEQKALFRTQLKMAEETGKKVIVHSRDAWEDTVGIVSEFPAVTGVFHCFGGSADGVAWLLRRGWMISFTGVLTFRNARRPLEVVKTIPLDRLMVETDAPYMAPEPNRGKRNDSRNLVYVIEKIAQIKGEPPEKIAEDTYLNACRFYGVEP